MKSFANTYHFRKNNDWVIIKYRLTYFEVSITSAFKHSITET